jgi:uncharacterized membrane protein YqjE
MTDPHSAGHHHGVGHALAQLADSLLALAITRGRLAGLELVEERERLLRRLALVAGGILLLTLAALFGGLLVVAAFWDTHRLAAIIWTGLAFLVAGALLCRYGIASRDGDAPFAATLAEFEKDRARLMRQRAPGGREE